MLPRSKTGPATEMGAVLRTLQILVLILARAHMLVERMSVKLVIARA